MKNGDPRVDAYIDHAAPFAKPILTTIRDAVHAACPDVQETIKWQMPFFEHEGILCNMAAFKAHCSMRFWHGQSFDRITSVDQLPSKKELMAMVRETASANAQGSKPARPKREPKAPLPTPDEFADAVSKNKKAKASFEQMPPSHKREYVEWITSAKGEATRARRIAQAVEWIAEGKSRNWKYEKK